MKKIMLCCGIGKKDKQIETGYNAIRIELPFKYRNKKFKSSLDIEFERDKDSITIRGDRALKIIPRASNTIKIVLGEE